jgi:hypothetical protein
MMFELENNTFQGITVSGINKHVKDTSDLMIPKQDKIWYKIENFLYKELKEALAEYLKLIHQGYNDSNERTFSFFINNNDLQADMFMIQKYEKQEGKYIYHNDFHVDFSQEKYRVLTYLWYLNDVHDGGETEFWGGDFNIKPETGKLILFPACWSYPHRGKMPISNNKYIITGWLYTHK